MDISLNDYLSSIGVLKHYGTPRHSGRYPWGSGEEGTSGTRNPSFLDTVADMKKSGMTETQIAQGLNMTTKQLRAAKSIAKNEKKQADVAMANRLKEKGYSNGAIAERMGLPGESSVRALLADGVKDKLQVLDATSDVLRKKIDTGAYVDVGTGVEIHMGVSRTKLDQAIAKLQEEGYVLTKVQVDQLGTENKTTLKVLTPPGTTYREVAMNKENIQQIKDFSEDGGRNYLGIQTPLSINSKRVAVRYAEDGGTDADGVIYVRPGVKDVSIGASRYAQVRIAVDGSHYLKGMAIYKDDLPDGVDLMFNTNKKNTGNKLDAMKDMKDDPDNPFGATVRQIIDPKTGKVTSSMNIVGSKDGAGEEGSWDDWSRNLPSQFLSKQSHTLAKQQLDVARIKKQSELDDIMRLTNPAVKQKLLESFADSSDSAAVHLKAASLPRQSTHVILPVNSLKPTEVYAPNFKHGERVSLVRFPHGGTFEIPELVVNKRNPEGKKLLGNAKDAIGINAKVAERLSGADFDGDTVLVIPNNKGNIKSTAALENLKGFDPKAMYHRADLPPMSDRTKGLEMGKASNLITDMTLKRASTEEIARAVRHSMVVIDAQKHSLDYKQSAIDHNINGLKAKYQGPTRGASTLISRASSDLEVRARKLRPAKDGGPIDPETGRKVYVETGENWVNKKGKTVYKTQNSTKLAETHDAMSLVSDNGGTKMEHIYADHSNKLKAMANDARKATLDIKPTPYSPSAKKAYASEVKTLNAKLTLAIQNRPLERQAQVFANAVVKQKTLANPNLTSEEKTRLKGQAITAARIRTGASKSQIHISDEEWNAIQAGAIRHSKLKDILNNADLERVKSLATPRNAVLMDSAKSARAKRMLDSGYDQAEVAEILGVSVTTLKRGIEGG